MKKTRMLLSILLTFVILLNLLPISAQAANELAFTVQPVSGEAKTSERYAFSWATNKTPDVLTLQIKNLKGGDDDWVDVGTLSGTAGSVAYRENTVTQTFSVNGKSLYRITALTMANKGRPAEGAVSDMFTVDWLPVYTVSFDANGGSGTMDAVTDARGEFILPQCTFAPPSGQQFGAWGVGDAEYDPGDRINVTANVTVKALWRDRTYTVTVNGGSGSGQYREGQTVEIMADSPEEGYRFEKWESNVSLTYESSDRYDFHAFFTMPAKNVTLTAVYEPDIVEYNTWVMGVQVTELNLNDVLGDGKVSYIPANGTEWAKLVLNGVNFSSSAGIPSGQCPIDTKEDLTIELKGANTVTTEDRATIWTENNMRVQSDGTGSLTLSSYAYGFYCSGSGHTLTFSGLKELNISVNTSIGADAIISFGGLTITDCGTVTSNSTFMTVWKDMLLQNGNFLFEVCRDEETWAIMAEESLTIRNARVEICAGSEEYEGQFNGIRVYDDFVVSAGSTVIVKDVLRGINANAGTTTVNDSDVSVSAVEYAVYGGVITLNGCAIDTEQTSAEILDKYIVKKGTDEPATEVEIVRTSEPSQCKVTVTVNNAAWGSVQVFGLSGGKINTGAAVTLRATAKPGCRFVGWKSGGRYLSYDLEYYAEITEDTVVTAEFDDCLYYNTWVGGVCVTSRNVHDVLGDGKVSYTPAEGTACAVLTLNGASITVEGSSRSPVETEEELIIRVQGSNRLVTEKVSGIYSDEDHLYLVSDGTGSLTVEAATYGIQARIGRVYVDGLKELTVTCGIDHPMGWGFYSIYSLGGLSFKNCGLVRVNNVLYSPLSSSARSMDMVVDNSRVEITMPEKGEDQTGTRDAIYAGKRLNIINGSYVLVQAENPTGENLYNGIYAQLGMEISDSTVKVTGADSAVYTGREVIINRSRLYLAAKKHSLYGGGDRDDPEYYYVQLNGCTLTTANTKLLNTVNYRDGWRDDTEIVYADTEEPALVCSIGTVLSEVNILGFTAPVSGAALDKDNVHRGYTEELDSCRVNNNLWYKIDPETGKGTLMENGQVFENGGTYRYRAFIVRKNDAFDAFPPSAEDITVNIEGLPADCERDVYFNAEGTVLTCDVIFVCRTSVTGTAEVSGRKAAVSVSVAGLDGSEATLLVARYVGDRLAETRMIPVTGDGTFSFTGVNAFGWEDGSRFAAYLVDGDYIPLCSTGELTLLPEE